MLAALAQATSRLRMGTMVTGIHYRHPAVLANMIATLDIISRAGSRWVSAPDGTKRNPVRTASNWAPRASAATDSRRPARCWSACCQAGVLVPGSLLPAHWRPERAEGAAASASADLHRRRRGEADAAHRGALRPALEHRGGTPEEFARKRDVLHAHCADIGRDPGEITLSSHVKFDPAAGASATADQAAALGEVGLDLAIVYLRPPLTPAVLEPLAAALAQIA